MLTAATIPFPRAGARGDGVARQHRRGRQPLAPGQLQLAKATAPCPQATTSPDGAAPGSLLDASVPSPGSPCPATTRGPNSFSGSLAQVGERPGPGIDPPGLGRHQRGRLPEVEQAVVLAQHRGQGGAGVVLGLQPNLPRWRSPARSRAAARAQRRQPRAPACRRCPASPMGSSRQAATGPVSSPSSMRMMQTPVRASPRITDHWMGAAPRYFGSSEPCTFQGPSRGMASSAGGRMRP